MGCMPTENRVSSVLEAVPRANGSPYSVAILCNEPHNLWQNQLEIQREECHTGSTSGLWKQQRAQRLPVLGRRRRVAAHKQHRRGQPRRHRRQQTVPLGKLLALGEGAQPHHHRLERRAACAASRPRPSATPRRASGCMQYESVREGVCVCVCVCVLCVHSFASHKGPKRSSIWTRC